MAEALHYLHSQQPALIHRDVKSLNVFLDADMKVGRWVGKWYGSVEAMLTTRTEAHALQSRPKHSHTRTNVCTLALSARRSHSCTHTPAGALASEHSRSVQRFTYACT